jgi:DNA-binding NtrC family response regulator
MELGAFDYVNKPFDLDDVAAVVGRAVAAHCVSEE